MNALELFDAWAPPDSVWSRWAKPALFAQLDGQTLPSIQGDRIDLNLAYDPGAAVIVDLPGPESVRAGLALAEKGYRPVPLFNSAFHLSGVVEVGSLARWLFEGASVLPGLAVAADAAPAFLLDSGRLAGGLSPAPGRFDNRWVVFPQDFPSATFLQSRRIQRAILWQRRADAQPATDLAHVLRRWQDAKVEVLGWAADADTPPQSLPVQRPSRFKSLWHVFLAVAGLRRNSAGGFGSIVPHPSEGSRRSGFG